MYFVIVQDQFHRKGKMVIGPFNSKTEAQDWASRKDQKLTSDEYFTVAQAIDPSLVLQD